MPADEPSYPALHVDVGEESLDALHDRLWELGATGLEDRDGSTLTPAEAGEVTVVAHFAEEGEARAALARLASEGFTGRYAPVLGDAWREGWKAFFGVHRVGRLVVRPPWLAADAGPEDVVVTVDPGQAFGTGTHATTQTALTLLVESVRGGERVLDVGSGSGILGVAALRLGAGAVRAIDSDPVAVRVTEATAAINGVDDRLEASVGDAHDPPDGRYDLVLANIRAPILQSAAPALAAGVAPGGLLVLGGILDDEAAQVVASFRAHGPWAGTARLGEPEVRHRDGWATIAWRRPDR
ncbi:MAG: 50S ribosomal protein L11 methyltransferase [Sandaracinaceae bacterium]